MFGVPRPQAVQWLRGSGCGGLYLRPFWTEQSGAAVARDIFHLLWVRNQLAKGPAIWEAVKHFDAVVGLLPGDKDVAIRLAADAPRRWSLPSHPKCSLLLTINKHAFVEQCGVSDGGDWGP